MASLDPDRFGDLVGRSRVMRNLFSTLRRVSRTATTLLVEGETGTGKDLCAKAVHRASSRTEAPFAVCDLAGVPRTLVESELFGHVKGAFTGATGDRMGAFELAHGGTLFLDEVGELELSFQPRLLRALEDRSVRPVGASQYRRIDVRIVAATNRDLTAEVEAGRFRSDLLHRLAVVRVRMPPLRDRKEDIPLLVEHLLAGTGVRLSPGAAALLQCHDWPGNIRELRNAIDRGLALTDGDVIDTAMLGLDPPGLSGQRSSWDEDPHPGSGREPYFEARQKVLQLWERSYLEQLLQETGGNVTQAARVCGIGRAFLHRLLRRHGLRL